MDRGCFVDMTSDRQDGALYIGVAADPTRRVREHREVVGPEVVDARPAPGMTAMPRPVVTISACNSERS